MALEKPIYGVSVLGTLKVMGCDLGIQKEEALGSFWFFF